MMDGGRGSLSGIRVIRMRRYSVLETVKIIFTNRKLRSTFYALGHVKIDIINELDGIIMINNEEGSGTDYDWNLGGLKIRIIH